MKSRINTKNALQTLQNEKLRSQLTWLLSISVFIMSLAFLYGRMRWGHLGSWLFINPGTLLHTDIYNDVFLNGGNLRDWYISYAPSVFPEFLTYFITRQLFSNFLTAMFVTSTILYLLLLTSVYFLFTTIFEEATTAHKQLFVVFLAVFNFLLGIGMFFSLRLFLLLPHYHVGMISACLFSVAICWKILAKAKTKLIYVLVPLVTISTLSDRIYLFSFVIPITFALKIISLKSNKKHTRRLMGYIWVASAVGIFSYFILLPNPYPIAGTQIPTLKSLAAYTGLLTSVFTSMHLQFNVGGRIYSEVNDAVILALLSTFFVLTLVLSTRKNPPKAYEKRITGPQGLFLASFTVSAFLTMAAVSITRTISNPSDLRHLTAPATISFFGAGFLGILLIPTNINRILIPSVSLVLTAVLLFYPKPSRNLLKKDALVDCLDSNYYTHGLKRGITGYWQARHTRVLSERNIEVVQMTITQTGVLQPYMLLTTKTYFACANGEKECEYNFVIPNEPELKKEDVIRKFGPPKNKFECGSHEVYVYETEDMTDIVNRSIEKLLRRNYQYYL